MWKFIERGACKFFNYSLINVYAPTNDKPDEEKEKFYELLGKSIMSAQDYIRFSV